MRDSFDRYGVVCDARFMQNRMFAVLLEKAAVSPALSRIVKVLTFFVWTPFFYFVFFEAIQRRWPVVMLPTSPSENSPIR